MGLFKHTPSEYPSFLLWFLDETHVTVTAGTALAILYSRDAHAVWFALGAVGSTLIARAIKHLIRQPRPPPPTESKNSPVRPKRTYGMPSTHSTALGFYFIYLLPLLPLHFNSLLEKAALTVVTGLGLWSRVALGYHTPAQVIAGAGVGAASAVVWSAIWRSNPDIRPFLQHTIDEAVALVWK